jgi:hypothetical protein
MDYKTKSNLIWNIGKVLQVLIFTVMMLTYCVIIYWMFSGIDMHSKDSQDIGVGAGIFLIGTFILWLHPTMFLYELVFKPFEKIVYKIQEPHRLVMIPFNVIYYNHEQKMDINYHEAHEDDVNLHVFIDENGQQHSINNPTAKYIPLSQLEK